METIRVSIVGRRTERKTWKTYLDTTKEMFNAERYAIGEVLSIAPKGRQIG